MRLLIICLAAVLAGSVSALADDAPPQANAASLEGCQFITNDCEICVVDDAGKVGCSTQGIACTPTKRWCLIDKDGRKASNE